MIGVMGADMKIQLDAKIAEDPEIIERAHMYCAFDYNRRLFGKDDRWSQWIA